MVVNADAASRKDHPGRSRTRKAAWAAVAAVVMLAATSLESGGVADAEVSRHEFEVGARRYAFTPARIEVRQDDLVRVAFHAEDIAHSFTLDSYRIAKRAAPGQRVTFEFRADRAGTFPFYCSLATEDRCRDMRGVLVVTER